MTNDLTDASSTMRGEAWEPVCPLEGGMSYALPDVTKVLRERHQQGLFRLGKVLGKAWKCGYESADEVIEDVRLAAWNIGMKISRDDVDIREKWEHVFKTKGRALRLRSPL